MEIEEEKYISKKTIIKEFKVDRKTLERIITDLSSGRPDLIQNHMKKGGYHNCEVFYDDKLVNMITAELAKHNTNQNTGIIQKQMNTQAKEQGILMNAVANSGDINAAKALCNLIMEKTQITAENKLLQTENKQLKIENNKLKEEAINAYNEGFEEGRYRLNYMYRYDIY